MSLAETFTELAHRLERETLDPTTYPPTYSITPTDLDTLRSVIAYLHAATAAGDRHPDPLERWPLWDGGTLGDDEDGRPGFSTWIAANGHRPILHLAGAYIRSSGRRDRNGSIVPAVLVDLLVGAVGTGPAYHVVPLVMDAAPSEGNNHPGGLASQVAEILAAAADAARLDVAAAGIAADDPNHVHAWIDVTNEVVGSGRVCLECGAVTGGTL